MKNQSVAAMTRLELLNAITTACYQGASISDIPEALRDVSIALDAAIDEIQDDTGVVTASAVLLHDLVR